MDHWIVPELIVQDTKTIRSVVQSLQRKPELRSSMVASHGKDCKGEGLAGLDRSADGERTCRSEATDEWHDRKGGVMRHRLNRLGLILGAVFLVSCTSVNPPARIGDYISYVPRAGDDAFTKINQRPLQAGLVVVSDTAERGAAPNLPEEGLIRLGESLQRDLIRAVPVAITEIFPSDHIRPQPHGDWDQFAELGRHRGVDYLAVVIVSSTEQEYPITLFLGLATHAQPGFRRDNWSLLEFALLDLKNGQILMQAEGRGWATLDRPSAPGIGQWYPAVYLRPQDQRRIWPPTYEGAPNTLRVVSFGQATKRLVVKLENAWPRVLELGVTNRKSSS